MKYLNHTSHDRDYFKPGKRSDGWLGRMWWEHIDNINCNSWCTNLYYSSNIGSRDSSLGIIAVDKMSGKQHSSSTAQKLRDFAKYKVGTAQSHIMTQWNKKYWIQCVMKNWICKLILPSALRIEVFYFLKIFSEPGRMFGELMSWP